MVLSHGQNLPQAISQSVPFFCPKFLQLLHFGHPFPHVKRCRGSFRHMAGPNCLVAIAGSLDFRWSTWEPHHHHRPRFDAFRLWFRLFTRFAPGGAGDRGEKPRSSAVHFVHPGHWRVHHLGDLGTLTRYLFRGQSAQVSGTEEWFGKLASFWGIHEAIL